MFVKRPFPVIACLAITFPFALNLPAFAFQASRIASSATATSRVVLSPHIPNGDDMRSGVID